MTGTVLRRGSHLVPAAVAAGLRLGGGGAGLVVGRDRAGRPVVADLFRPDRAVSASLFGGLRAGQLLVMRALDLGVRVTVHTRRPAPWGQLGARLGIGRDVYAVLSPDGADPTPPSQDRPLLTVLDTGPLLDVRDPPQVGPYWQATLVLREEVSGWDVLVLARSDLVVLQPLTSAEASVVASALRMREAAQGLTGIRGDVVGVVSGGRLDWARLAATGPELLVVGPPVR